jgi:hypothetical protein
MRTAVLYFVLFGLLFFLPEDGIAQCVYAGGEWVDDLGNTWTLTQNPANGALTGTVEFFCPAGGCSGGLCQGEWPVTGQVAGGNGQFVATAHNPDPTWPNCSLPTWQLNGHIRMPGCQTGDGTITCPPFYCAAEWSWRPRTVRCRMERPRRRTDGLNLRGSQPFISGARP